MWLNFTNQVNNRLFSGKCCEWRASVAGDKCFWGPLLPGGGKLPSQILSELFSVFILSCFLALVTSSTSEWYSSQTLGSLNCLLLLMLVSRRMKVRGAKRLLA